MNNYTALYETVISLVPAESKVTEFGCGYGEFAGLLHTAKKVKSYSGIDIDAIAIRQAMENNPELAMCFHNADLMKLGFKDVGTFIALEVLEHLSGDIELLGKIPKGSRVLISIPSFDSHGHRRFFPSEYEAIKRYENAIDIDLWRKIKIPTGGGYFHVIRGYR